MPVSPLLNTPSPALQERWLRLRSHKRIISKVKLLVEWDEGPDSQCANAVTVEASHAVDAVGWASPSSGTTKPVISVARAGGPSGKNRA